MFGVEISNAWEEVRDTQKELREIGLGRETAATRETLQKTRDKNELRP